jgi:hypothetical protein
MRHWLNIVGGVAIGAVVCAALPAKASTYDVSFAGSFFDVFANITTDASDNVTTIVGTVTGLQGLTGGAISGLEPLGTQPAWIYDNKLTATAPFVSNPGILFDVGTVAYNLYSSGSDYFLSTMNPDGSHYNPGDAGTLAVTQTPLPAAGLLFASGIVAGLIARRRKKAPSRKQPLAA